MSSRHVGPDEPAPDGARVAGAPGARQAEALFPVFLRLTGRKVVLVGGGKVAAAKLEALLDARAVVTVVAPEIADAVARPEVTLRRRPFAPSDLDGAWLAIAAATPEANARVREAADERRVFVNAADDPQSASAYTAGILRRGGVTVAVSTEGRAPALAGLLREGLDTLLPEEIEAWVREAHALRERQRLRGVPIGRRRPLLLDALNRLYASKRKAPASPTFRKAVRP